MDVDTALNERRSIRSFSSRPVPPKLIDELLETALLSPSWSNTQPYMVAVAQDNIRDELAKQLTQKFEYASSWQRNSLLPKIWSFLKKSPLPDGDFKPVTKYPADLQPLRQATGFGLYNHLGIARNDYQARQQQMAKNFSFFDAPVVLFVFMHKGLGVYSALDAGIFMQSLMLSATHLGLGTCAQGALAVWRSPVEAFFNIPDNYQLLSGLSIGYPSDDSVNQYRPVRKTLDEIKIPMKVV